MRRIGSLPDGSLARRFCDYLVTLSIDSTTEVDDDGSEQVWNIWIRDERDVEKARAEFRSFEAAPDEPRYQVQNEASRIRNEHVAEQQRRLKQQRKLTQSMPRQSGGIGPLSGAAVKQQSIPITMGIIILSVIASFATNFSRPRNRGAGETLEMKAYFLLSFTDRRDFLKSGDPYESVKKGQLWRIFTPMLIHGSPMHLVFNMLWVFFLGSAIERLHGSVFFTLLALGTHAVGTGVELMTFGMDFLPEAFQGSPFAIGASGAVYGLFGYLWIRPAVDPAYPIRLVPLNIVLMLGWLFLCMTPLIEDIANGAHVGGLAAGMTVAMLGTRQGHG
ncbi:MAG: rhomboid family intramembrane serine protease [Pirellulales bacterium]|nr:rhomboid family intramembrane serine protease [Pirellulales bacterium]